MSVFGIREEYDVDNSIERCQACKNKSIITCALFAHFNFSTRTIEVNQVICFQNTHLHVSKAHKISNFSAENTLLRIRAHAHFRNHESRTTSSSIDMFRGIIFSSKIGRTSEKRSRAL